MLRHLPNILSGLRLALAPATAGFVATDNFMAAFGVFALAGVTDALDGRLAKALNSSTEFGKVLDPIADKALMTAAFLALAFIGDVPVWLAALVIGRDALIGAGVGICVLRGAKVDTTPLFLGKLTTTLQITYLGVHLGALAFALSLARIVPIDAYAVAGLTLASGAAYGARWVSAMRARAPA